MRLDPLSGTWKAFISLCDRDFPVILERNRKTQKRIEIKKGQPAKSITMVGSLWIAVSPAELTWLGDFESEPNISKMPAASAGVGGFSDN